MPIAFYYQVPSFSVKNKKQVQEWILTVAFIEKKEIEKIDYVFCNDEFLLGLNTKFLHHKTLTDIITFDDSQDNVISAEIYISIPRVKENAAIFETSFQKELYRVMIHGVLHCMGYRDKSKKDQRKMRRLEEKYLRMISPTN